ncbi:MAG: hypothetical protein EXS29_06130 [Pedosphaera sp.]|nr:hypothetical protein [Pedosphaera sp.]
MTLHSLKTSLALALVGLFAAGATAADAPKPLRALLITGGCCHDYAKQKDILKKGLEARANVVVDQIHSDDKGTKPPLPIYGNADYAKGYDIVIHDECSADIKDPAVIAGVLAPHRKGIPGVNLHCAMHCYRFGNIGQPVKLGDANASWFEYLGLQSTGHGPQEPIAIRFTDKSHAVTKGLDDWTTVKEELYNNIQIFPTATALASGKQSVKQKDGSTKNVETVVSWVNDFKGTRVFSTTIGHNNATVEDARYLDLVARGLLWACGKLDDNGQPKAGYGPATNTK